MPLPVPPPSDLPSFHVAVLRSWRGWFPSACAVAVVSYLLAGVWDAQRQLHAVVWLAVGFVVLPVLFTLALLCVAAAATVLLVLLSLPAVAVGRETGLGPLLRQLWALPGSVLPGFWRALRRVRQPLLWGVLLGFAVGTLGWFVLRAAASGGGA